VVQAQAPADPRQGWLVKEEVYPSDTPKDWVQKAEVESDFKNIQDAHNNLIWGTSASDPTLRWILIE
jgi:hypothetical protein